MGVVIRPRLFPFALHISSFVWNVWVQITWWLKITSYSYSPGWACINVDTATLTEKGIMLNHNKPQPDVSGASQWRHNGRDVVSNLQPHHCLLNRLFRRRSKTTSKLRVTGPCAGNSPVAGEFPAQMASSAEIVSTWWRHHGALFLVYE